MVIEATRLSRSQPLDIELHSPANLARMSLEQRLAHESACKSAIESLQVQLDRLHPISSCTQTHTSVSPSKSA